jgi:hypothetical protein
VFPKKRTKILEFDIKRLQDDKEAWLCSMSHNKEELPTQILDEFGGKSRTPNINERNRKMLPGNLPAPKS